MLKPIASALIASTVLMGSSAAMANDWFVGGTVGKVQQKITLNDEDGLEKDKLKDTYFGLRAGKYINDNFRAYANVGRFKDKVSGGDEPTRSIKNVELSFSADYVDNLFQLQNTKYFVGGTLGFNRMNAWIDDEDGRETKNDNGLIYGAQLGLIQEFTPALSAEIGYRYARTTNKVKMFDGDLTIRQKAQKMPYISVSYRF